MALPKIETLTTHTASTWGINVDAAGAKYLTASDRFLSSTAQTKSGSETSLIADFQTLLAAEVGSTVAVVSPTTGKVGIVWGDAGGHDLVWTDTGLRDALGFDGDIASGSGAAVVGADQADCLWLPNVQASGLRGSVASRGARLDDSRLVRSKSGKLWGTSYNQYTEETFIFRGVTKALTWTEDEGSINESFESLWAEYLTRRVAFRFYTDITGASSYLTTNGLARDYVYARQGYNPTRIRTNYDGSWSITFPAFLLVV